MGVPGAHLRGERVLRDDAPTDDGAVAKATGLVKPATEPITPHVTPQVTPQVVALLEADQEPRSRGGLQRTLGLTQRLHLQLTMIFTIVGFVKEPPQ